MKPIAIIVAGLLLAACQEPGARSGEEEANASVIRRSAEAFDEHRPPAEYMRDLMTEDFTHTGFTPWSPGGATRTLDEVIEIVRQNHDLSPDRRQEVLSVIVEGDQAAIESRIRGSRRDIHSVRFLRFRGGKIAQMREYILPIPRPGDAPASRTPQEQANEAAIRKMTESYNAGSMDEYFSYWAEDVTWEAGLRELLPAGS